MLKSRQPPAGRLPHRYEWLWEPLADDATFVLRSMFGARAVYLDGKMVLRRRALAWRAGLHEP
jgi:hypothetical protein